MVNPAMRIVRSICLLASLGLAATRLSTAAEPAATSLEALGREMMVQGLPNRVPSPIAEALGLEPNAPAHNVKISEEQAADHMYHLAQVLVELSTTTPPWPIRPIGFVLGAYRLAGRQSDDYHYRATLDGTLARAIHIDGEVDTAGRGIKGSGKLTQEDVESPAVRQRFQHELDLWLKRRYLKKEWRSAELSGGALKKKGKAR